MLIRGRNHSPDGGYPSLEVKTSSDMILIRSSTYFRSRATICSFFFLVDKCDHVSKIWRDETALDFVRGEWFKRKSVSESLEDYKSGNLSCKQISRD